MDKTDVPSTAVIGISSGVNIHKWVYCHIVNVSSAMSINFHFCTVRSYTHDSPTQHGHFFTRSIFCFMETKVTHSNINPAIDSHSDAIRSMVSSTASKRFWRTNIFNQRVCRAISHAIVICIDELNQVHAFCFTGSFIENCMQNKNLISYRHDTTWIIGFRKFGFSFIDAVIVLVYEFHNGSFPRFFA